MHDEALDMVSKVWSVVEVLDDNTKDKNILNKELLKSAFSRLNELNKFLENDRTKWKHVSILYDKDTE